MRVPTDPTFIKDTSKTLGQGFISRKLIMGLPIGPNAVNTKKVEALTKTIFNSGNKTQVARGSMLGKS